MRLWSVAFLSCFTGSFCTVEIVDSSYVQFKKWKYFSYLIHLTDHCSYGMFRLNFFKDLGLCCACFYTNCLAVILPSLISNHESPPTPPHCLVKMPSVSIPLVLRAQQPAARAKNPHKCPTCPKVGSVGIHFDWCIIKSPIPSLFLRSVVNN